MRTLYFNTLKENIPIIPPVIGAFIAQAAAVALTINGHKSGVVLKLRGIEKGEFQIIWAEKIKEDVLKGWADLREAAEYGAVAISILTFLEVSDFNYFERNHQGFGFDYWLDSYIGKDWRQARQNKKARLEVSGILKESKTNSIKMRVGVKKKQY